MTYSNLFSAAILLIATGLLSSCQEEEDASRPKTSIHSNLQYDRFEPVSPLEDPQPIIDKTVLSSDERTTEILRGQAELYFLIRPKGCPRRAYRPLCEPGFEFLLAGAKGIDIEGWYVKEGFEGFIVDPRTGSVVAELTDIMYDEESQAPILVYTATEDYEIASKQLQVTFGTLYDTGRSLQKVGFEGEVSTEIIEYLR